MRRQFTRGALQAILTSAIMLIQASPLRAGIYQRVCNQTKATVAAASELSRMLAAFRKPLDLPNLYRLEKALIFIEYAEESLSAENVSTSQTSYAYKSNDTEANLMYALNGGVLAVTYTTNEATGQSSLAPLSAKLLFGKLFEDLSRRNPTLTAIRISLPLSGQATLQNSSTREQFVKNFWQYDFAKYFNFREVNWQNSGVQGDRYYLYLGSS